ncbi:MAG: PIN domain-containing protein [Longimicrobiales bacterium]|nr:PIN domain-containing protein [Longimicrobiales bacterium]
MTPEGPASGMVHLLDVNVLVALFDPAHLHHDAAHAWFGTERERGWATCPITQNGFLRVLSNPAYPGRRTPVADAAGRLRLFLASAGHVFWPDDASLVDEGLVSVGHLAGHREITDAYLLALAVKRKGRLATFDRNLRLAAVRGAEASHVTVVAVGV